MFTSNILTIQSTGYIFNQAQHFITTFPVQYSKYYLQFIYFKKNNNNIQEYLCE